MLEISFVLRIVLFIWLLLCSWQDVKKKEINIVLIGAGFIILFILSIIQGEIKLWERIAGLALGLILLLFNRVTRGQIGVGDGLILSIIGLTFGFVINSIILVYSLFSAAFFSIFIMIFKKANHKKTIPFIPFVLIAFVGVFFFG